MSCRALYQLSSGGARDFMSLTVPNTVTVSSQGTGWQLSASAQSSSFPGLLMATLDTGKLEHQIQARPGADIF